MKDLKEHLKQVLRPSFMVFCNNIVGSQNTRHAAEIGVDEGFNALAMLKNTDMDLLLVDPYLEDGGWEAKQKMVFNLKDYWERVKFLQLTSVEAAERSPDGFFDYVYIDGSHEPKDVYNDCCAWWSKVRSGGMMAGHDFLFVREAVQQFVFEKGISPLFCVEIYLPNGNNTVPSNFALMSDWWVYKDIECDEML